MDNRIPSKHPLHSDIHGLPHVGDSEHADNFQPMPRLTGLLQTGMPVVFNSIPAFSLQPRETVQRSVANSVFNVSTVPPHFYSSVPTDNTLLARNRGTLSNQQPQHSRRGPSSSRNSPHTNTTTSSNSHFPQIQHQSALNPAANYLHRSAMSSGQQLEPLRTISTSHLSHDVTPQQQLRHQDKTMKLIASSYGSTRDIRHSSHMEQGSNLQRHPSVFHGLPAHSAAQNSNVDRPRINLQKYHTHPSHQQATTSGGSDHLTHLHRRHYPTTIANNTSNNSSNQSQSSSMFPSSTLPNSNDSFRVPPPTLMPQMTALLNSVPTPSPMNKSHLVNHLQDNYTARQVASSSSSNSLTSSNVISPALAAPPASSTQAFDFELGDNHVRAASTRCDRLSNGLSNKITSSPSQQQSPIVTKTEPITPKIKEPEEFKPILPQQPTSLLNMRYKNVINFPKYKQRKNSSFEKRMRRNGLHLDGKMAMATVRKLLQTYVNRDMDAVLEKYMKTFFMEAVKNIRENLGEESFTDSDVEKLRGRIMKRVCKRYLMGPTEDLSDTNSGDDQQGIIGADDNASDTMSECSNLSSDRKGGRKSTSPFASYRNHQNESDTESTSNRFGALLTNPEEVKLPKKRKYTKSRNSNNTSGRSTPQKAHNPKKRKQSEAPLPSQGKVDVSSFDTNTLFVLGSTANNWLGLGAARGRIYSKHPTLFRYHCDQSDKNWLVEKGHMTSHGVKAFIMLSEEVQELGMTHSYTRLIDVQRRGPLTSFLLPPSLLEKIKTFFGAVRPLIQLDDLDGAVENEPSPDPSPGIPFSQAHTTYPPMTALHTNACFFRDQLDFEMGSSPPMHEIELSPNGQDSSEEERPNSADMAGISLCTSGSFVVNPLSQTSPQPPRLDRFDQSPYNSEFEDLE